MKVHNPYVGPRAFEEKDSPHFFGREVETRQLVSLIIAHQVVLLYAQSGAGKTSLLRAGVIPDLNQDQEVKILPIVRVGGDLPPNVDVARVKNIYVFNALLDFSGEDARPEDLERRTLLEGLAPSIVSQPSLLILDQFEELFTTHPDHYQERADFFLQLQHSLKAHPQLSLLLSMREDYIAHLDPYAAQLPDRLRTRFRLELLGEKAARQAMQQPARQVEIDFTDTAAEKLVNDLRKVQIQQSDGTTTEQLGRHIEPVQLQVVCHRLWEHLPEEAKQIRKADIEMVGDVDTALADYYADRVKTTAQKTGVHERAIREWFGDYLITEQGLRGLIPKGPEQSQGLDNRAISLLVDTHLVRAEKRLNATWYELSHDRLIEPVRKNNREWFQANLSTLQRQADLWESRNRSSGLLLRDEALEEAEAWVVDYQGELTLAEHDFLSACREARAQAKKERFKNRFILGLAIIAVVISIIAVRQWLEAERLRYVSIAQALAAQALSRQDDTGALLARQAYFLNQRNQGHILAQVDHTLRTILNAPTFNHTLGDHYWDEEVLSVTFSPDGLTLASGGKNNTIFLWNLNNPGVEPIPLDGHTDAVFSVAFSPDGKILASGSDDDTVLLWNLQDDNPESTILGNHDGGISIITFSSDGKTLASGSDDTIIRLWDLQNSDAEPTLLEGHDDGISSLALSSDGNTIVSGAYDGSVLWWDLQNDPPESIILGDYEDWVSFITFSPDGKTLVLGSHDNSIRLWDLPPNPNAEPTILEGHEGEIRSMAFSPDGKTLASSAYDNTVRLWNLQDPGTDPIILSIDEGVVLSVAFSPDGKILASGASGNTVQLWDLQTPSALPTYLYSLEGEYVWSMAFDSEGRTLASGSEDGTVRLWNIKNPGITSTMLHSRGLRVISVAFSPDGQTLASGSEDRTILLWDPQNPNNDPFILPGHQGSVNALAFSPDGKTLASGSDDTTVRLWDLKNSRGKSSILGKHKDSIFSLAFNPDGKILASGSAETVLLWDLNNSDANSIILEHKEPVMSIAFSPDGKTLASGGEDKTVRIWDLKNPDSPTPLSGHTDIIFSLAFSPDGKTLASGSKDNTVRLWDLKNPENNPFVLRRQKGTVLSVQFSPDGQTLASGYNDKTILIWTVHTKILAEKVCQKVRRNLTLDEWHQFIGIDIPYQRTCSNLPPGQGVSLDTPANPN